MGPRSEKLSFAPSASFNALEERDALSRVLRAFFHERGFLEVETPLLAREIVPELHLEPIEVVSGSQPSLWLQASPELYMKRLMASGAEAIFQVARSFRADEVGQLHNPEFTIVEWYRRGDDLAAGMDLLDALVQTTLGTSPALRTTYAEAFERQTGLDPHRATPQQLAMACQALDVAVPDGFDRRDRDEWLNLLLATRIEPTLGREAPEIVYHYPASQASLARISTSPRGVNVAERFELYYRGIELANGFHELADAEEQRRRFEDVNDARTAAGRAALPLPTSLLAALEHGLPDCTGCALGFDRLVMLATEKATIRDVMAFPHFNA